MDHNCADFLSAPIEPHDSWSLKDLLETYEDTVRIRSSKYVGTEPSADNASPCWRCGDTLSSPADKKTWVFIVRVDHDLQRNPVSVEGAMHCQNTRPSLDEEIENSHKQAAQVYKQTHLLI